MVYGHHNGTRLSLIFVSCYGGDYVFFPPQYGSVRCTTEKIPIGEGDPERKNGMRYRIV